MSTSSDLVQASHVNSLNAVQEEKIKTIHLIVSNHVVSSMFGLYYYNLMCSYFIELPGDMLYM